MLEQREVLGLLGAALVALSTDTSLSVGDFETISQCLGVLKHFRQATIEISLEKRVSRSKVIPLIQMAQTQIDSSVYNLVKLVSLCLSLMLNTFLGVPLLLAITRPPSLLRHARFLLLIHLLCCNTLQLLLWTVTAVILISTRGMPVAQCLLICSATQTCSLVELFLSTALAVDRCVAIKWPLRYDLLVCPRRKRMAVVAVWAVPAAFSIVGLCIGLSTLQKNPSVPRCRPVILAPCLSDNSALLVYCTAVSGVFLIGIYLTIPTCFFLQCWDIQGRGLCTKRAWVTLSLQAAQIILYTIPVILDSYLVPSYLHSDGLDIATTTIYNLGISLIPVVYGYRSRELQQRILKTGHGAQVTEIR